MWSHRPDNQQAPGKIRRCPFRRQFLYCFPPCQRPPYCSPPLQWSPYCLPPPQWFSYCSPLRQWFDCLLPFLLFLHRNSVSLQSGILKLLPVPVRPYPVPYFRIRPAGYTKSCLLLSIFEGHAAPACAFLLCKSYTQSPSIYTAHRFNLHCDPIKSLP